MDVLDEMTLRRRRDRLLNPITAPLAALESALFTYQPIPIAADNVFLRLQGISTVTGDQFQGMTDQLFLRDAQRRAQQDDGGPAFNTRSRDDGDDSRNVRQRSNPIPLPPPPPNPPIRINLDGQTRAPHITHPPGQNIYTGPVPGRAAAAA